jgi:hypothetical protein
MLAGAAADDVGVPFTSVTVEFTTMAVFRGGELAFPGQVEDHVVAGQHLGRDAGLPSDDHRVP